MKLPLLVALTFIFVSQLYLSECQFSNSFFPQSVQYKLYKFRNTMKNLVNSTKEILHLPSRSTKESSSMSGIFIDRLNAEEKGEAGSQKKHIFDHFEFKRPDEDPITHMSSMTSPQLIALHGYPAESHTIVTDDGYILTIHRIPYSKKSENKVSPKKTVLLHHGLLGSSGHWLIPGPSKALGYILSDAGYDVWLANVRGNTYSRAHINRDVKSSEFWDFTFHEVSQHDLPAVIDYITEIKGSDVKINYIGHSMGTTVLFALLSTKPQYNNVLKAGFALAPVAYMTNIKSTIKDLAKHSDDLQYIAGLLGRAKELAPQTRTVKWLSKHVSKLMKYDRENIFGHTLFSMIGIDEKQFNKTLLPLILGQAATSASTKTLVHYAQEINQNGKFQMFDYGSERNLIKYGTSFPPQYPLHKITLPIALFSGENDWLSSVIDAKNLHKELVNPIDHYIVPYKKFSHSHFLWGIDAPTLLYARLLELLEEGYRGNQDYSGVIKSFKYVSTEETTEETTEENKTRKARVGEGTAVPQDFFLRLMMESV